MDPSPAARRVTTDDWPALAAAGVIAYALETMLHEAVGHGGVCLLQGERVTLLAPLFMRCSGFSPAMVAAGPAMNCLTAALAFAWLRWARPRGPLASLLIWLSFTFNALVACGYLAVGAATGFGDWPALAAAAHLPPWWRLPAGLAAAGAYYACLRLAAVLFRRQAGGAGAVKTLWRRALLPAAAAAVMACLAEAAGGRAQILPMLLALACTLGVGLSMTRMTEIVGVPAATDRDLGCVGRSWPLVGAGLVVALLYVGVIGPGLVPWHGP
jgi:hypothetical protein